MTKQPCWISDWKWPSSRFEFLNENNQAAMLNFWMEMTKQPCLISEWKWSSTHSLLPCWIFEWKWPRSHDDFRNENDQANMLNFWMKMTKQPCWISEWKWPSSHVPSTLLDRKHPLLWGQRLWITNLLNTLFKAFSDPRVFLTLICYCIFQIHVQTLFFMQ